ncbi:MAG: lipopolysaccharide heptosyltransferase I [Azoarcus sp.]|jgi:heptosyltransferase-1|nr:lipopolysaccharide heptosyltransferase I [Azoarcus sp.]
MRALIVKTSSLGDVIHTLPAVTDAARALPGIRFDWVVEEAFAEIPGWHPAVGEVLPVALRRWRTQPFAAATRRAFRAFQERLAATTYDLVIDAQGLLKSAWLARRARGPIHGLDRHSAREPLASFFYARRHAVPWGRHAVLRVRELFAAAFGYDLPAAARGEDDGARAADAAAYGLDRARVLAGLPSPAPARPRLVFLHGTTWPTKHWPETHWRQLAETTARAGEEIRLPWGNDRERERAERIADGIEYAQVLPKSTLAALAAELIAASACVAVDTGLGHLAAALDVPTLSLFGPTNPAFTGAWGWRQRRLASGIPCAPCLARKCNACDLLKPASTTELVRWARHAETPCLARLSPDIVRAALDAMLAGRG